MQIVISVDDDFYARLFSHRAEHIADAFDALHIIKNGIPLPKGHGRLIDADAVLEEPIGNTYKDIDIAETIIEADKESKDADSD